MSLELIREPVSFAQSIGWDSTQTIIENDIIVPDIKPDIARILLLDGDVFIKSAESAAEKILIDGTIRYKILYLTDDPDQPVKSINTTSDFRYPMEIPNTRQGMQCKVKCDILYMEHEIINSRKVNIKSILSLYGKVSEQVERHVTKDIDGAEEIQVLKKTFNITSRADISQSICTLDEILEVPSGKPAILEILRNDMKISNKETQSDEDGIIAKGLLSVSTLYLGDEERPGIQYMEHEIPFNHHVSLPGSDAISFCNMDYSIGEAEFEAEEDSDGELRLLRTKITLDINTEYYEEKTMKLVEDAYSPNTLLSLEKEEVSIEKLTVENRGQVTLKESMDIGEDSPDISEIFNIIGRLSISGWETAEDCVTVEGTVLCDILYLADNEIQPAFCVRKEVPFSRTLEVRGIKAGIDPDIDMNIDHLSYSILSAREVELRIIIGLRAKASATANIPIVVKATEQPLDTDRRKIQPSLILYFTQAGDTLWKIAKKYRTTIDEILADNEDLEVDKAVFSERDDAKTEEMIPADDLGNKKGTISAEAFLPDAGELFPGGEAMEAVILLPGQQILLPGKSY